MSLFLGLLTHSGLKAMPDVSQRRYGHDGCSMMIETPELLLVSMLEGVARDRIDQLDVV